MAAPPFLVKKPYLAVIGACAALISFTLVGCPSSSSPGPPSVQETSVKRPNLNDRIKFVERYVRFRRSYKKLEYSITYQNNGGGLVAGPSDWDIRLLAVVPPDEVKDWIPAQAIKMTTSPTWLKNWPGTIRTTGLTEWYSSSGIEVGIDRSTSTIAYRNTTT